MSIRAFVKILLGLCLFIAAERFCHKQTAGFAVSKIGSVSATPLTPEADVPLDAYLGQPYRFLGKGGQCYAFLSEDGRTVLKLFKNHHIRIWNWLNTLPLPQSLDATRRAYLEKNRHQSPTFYQSCQIADRDFKERTGLIYLHIGKTTSLHRKLTLYDKLGIAHPIDLDQVDFALQKKAAPCRDTLRALIRNNDLDGAKACIDSILGLIRERCQKGIRDRDPNLRKNLGFIGTTAIEIDLGSFTQEAQPQNYLAEVQRNTRKLKKWLHRHHQELSRYLIDQEEKINNGNNSPPSLI